MAWPPAQTQRTIADALRADQVGELPMRHLLSQVHDIVTVSEDEIRETMRLLATGARHSYFGKDEWEPFAPGLKKIDDATAMRSRVLAAFERAEGKCMEFMEITRS